MSTISRILRLEGSSFYSKSSKLDVHFTNAIKNHKKLFVSEKTAFEVVAGNFALCDGNPCTRQSMCLQRVLRFQIGLRESFSNSLYPRFIKTFDNSGPVLI